MTIIATYADIQFSMPITYTFNLVFSILGVEHEIMPYSESDSRRANDSNLLVSYGHKKVEQYTANHIHFYQSRLFSRDYRSISSMPQLPLKRWKGIPVIYEGSGHIEDLVVRNGNVIETSIDIIASSFFMLSRYEESIVDKRDQYDRFPAQASVAYKEGFLTRPVVNEYIDLLWEWIDSFNLGFKRKRLWNGKDFAACLTHDIDMPEKWNKSGLYSEVRHWAAIALKKRKPLSAASRMTKAVASMLSSHDPCWNFDRIMDMEEQYGFSSSFYFFGGGIHPLDARYSVKDSEISGLLSEIQSRGHEVGLHGSFDSYNNLEMLRSEKQNLETVAGQIFSIRQHYLRFDVQETFAIYEKLGIKCDVTLGFAAHEGFRAGMCLAFYPYNLEEDRPFDVLEIPLTVMDSTLSDAKYRGMNAEEAWQSVESLLTIVKRYGGCIVLLCHSSHLDKLDYPDYAEVYKRALKWTWDNNGIGTSSRAISENFQQLHQTPSMSSAISRVQTT